MNNQSVDAHYADRVRDSFANQIFLKTLGATLGRIQPGEVEIEAPFKKKLTQQDGFLHAGVITALVDTACGYAAYSLMPAGSRVLSVEYKINMLSPAVGERFLARGRVIKSGKTLTVCEGKLYANQADQKRLIAVMQATMICVNGGT
jgi:uncharacterized protein (TIGR00369 family)